ncbi:hypothetical protein RHODGE_RHODGE_03317 [Rhodoplanes serenus]|uniref:Portal protein n=1 Tax=Rhodoplanes serenus TaxID=200615 RepID=A0A3S4CIK6_9BRAD|nr:hypothetical protein [Rhodoplanes serenus]VCU10131.1 hypothetical protein RHODGE_RHODGE_03317 [Rhodoplanes serenus]
MADTGYAPGGSGVASVPAGGADHGGLSLGELKRRYLDYLSSKRDEIAEQKEARRYYHGAHWTPAQLKTLKKRNQPAMTFNEIGRKIDGVVGLIERLRQDPRAYPRTPQHEQGAELATAVLRYVLDQQDWKAKSPETARDGAIDGIGGVELGLTGGDTGGPDDLDIEIDVVEPDTFFYDPQSIRADFSDARFLGVSKWVDIEAAIELVPAKREEIEASIETSTELSTDSDREARWFASDGARKRVRLVDHWYMRGGQWWFALHTGSTVLMEGRSYLVDEKGRTFCRYIMFSANTDHDGDRYGFVRNMRSAQDGINAKQSKLQHILASRRLILRTGAVGSIEKTRAEMARPDGVIELPPKNAPIGDDIKIDDQSFDFMGWSKLLELNQASIQNFGPNPALIGGGLENSSGRAIALLQQAGIAELGPYILAYRGWKMRVYRAVWNMIRQYWTAERWVRVTDDDGLAQFAQINGMDVDPQTGMPTLVNAIGSLDVDIIIDEGPDSVNMMADSYDTLTALAAKGANVPPRVLLELAPLASSVKKKVTDLLDQASQQPPPEVAARQAEMQLKQQDAQASIQIEAQKAAQSAQLRRDELAASIAMKRERMQADLVLERERAAAQIMLEREKQMMQSELAAQKVAAGIEIERERAGRKAAVPDATT